MTASGRHRPPPTPSQTKRPVVPPLPAILSHILRFMHDVLFPDIAAAEFYRGENRSRRGASGIDGYPIPPLKAFPTSVQLIWTIDWFGGHGCLATYAAGMN